MTYSASGLPSGLSINPSTGVIQGTIVPQAGYLGSFTPTIAVHDGMSSASGSIAWTVYTPISIVPLPDQTGTEGSAVNLAVYASDSTAGATLHYSASGLPFGLGINPSTGVISGTIGAGASLISPYAATISVTDGAAGNSVSLNWSVASAIAILPVPDQSNTEGDAVSLHIHGFDSTSGPSLTYSAIGLPMGLSINPSTALIYGTVAPGDALAGPYTPTITVRYMTSSSSTSFNWSVASAIAIMPPPAQSNSEGDTVSVHVHATDATTGASLTYSASGLPSGLSINPSSGLISGTVALGDGSIGLYTPTLTVSDGVSRNSAGLNWSIASAIVIAPIGPQSHTEGDSVTLQVQASDSASGATLTYSAVNLPAGLTLTASSGLIHGTIAAGDAIIGSYLSTLSVSAGGSHGSTTVDWSIASAIEVTPVPAQSNTVGDTVGVQIHASDLTSGRR